MIKYLKFPDGYNGDKVECEVAPIEESGETLKLRVKDTGMIKWVSRKDWEEKMNEALAGEAIESLVGKEFDMGKIRILKYYIPTQCVPCLRRMGSLCSVYGGCGRLDSGKDEVAAWAERCARNGWPSYQPPYPEIETDDGSSWSTNSQIKESE